MIALAIGARTVFPIVLVILVAVLVVVLSIRRR